ncbi:putative paraflagellar rod protein 1D, partial [Leishmania braziliensis MHOM/BR/75/M2904]
PPGGREQRGGGDAAQQDGGVQVAPDEAGGGEDCGGARGDQACAPAAQWRRECCGADHERLAARRQRGECAAGVLIIFSGYAPSWCFPVLKRWVRCCLVFLFCDAMFCGMSVRVDSDLVGVALCVSDLWRLLEFVYFFFFWMYVYFICLRVRVCLCIRSVLKNYINFL